MNKNHEIMAMNGKTMLAHRDQRGMVLFISLMFLVVMTLIGITAMSGAGLQEKMAGNMRDKELSFEAAEAALRDAEVSIPTLSAFNNANGLYKLANNTGQQRFEVNSWNAAAWTNSANTIAYSKSLSQVVQSPRYYIEQLPPVELSRISGNSLNTGTEYGKRTIVFDRITARGVGQTDTAVTILQSTYRRD